MSHERHAEFVAWMRAVRPVLARVRGSIKAPELECQAEAILGRMAR
jgi:hypothetical protein